MKPLESAMTTRTRADGEFCWINVLTPQPERARDFFRMLLRWSFTEIPGTGHRIQIAGHDIGAIFDVNSSLLPPGTPPAIGVMVKVANAEAARERILALGGDASPTRDIGAQGRTADCRDPNGAFFDIWEPKLSPGTDVDARRHGAPTWFETLTSDAARATAFYSALFGWTPQASTTDGLTYTTFRLGTESVAGMMQITPEMGPMPSHWGVYFAVDDLDAATRDALSHGASAFMPAKDIPGVGRLGGLASPQGVMFYLLQYT